MYISPSIIVLVAILGVSLIAVVCLTYIFKSRKTKVSRVINFASSGAFICSAILFLCLIGINVSVSSASKSCNFKGERTYLLDSTGLSHLDKYNSHKVNAVRAIIASQGYDKYLAIKVNCQDKIVAPEDLLKYISGESKGNIDNLLDIQVEPVNNI